MFDQFQQPTHGKPNPWMMLVAASLVSLISIVGCQTSPTATPAATPVAEAADEEVAKAAEEAPAGDSEASEPEAPLSNALKWSTASEVDNFGYDIYRGDSEEGPFERITESPLPGNGTTDEPSFYHFEDVDIDPRRDYFYYIESISMAGERERFTPVIRSKAKIADPATN